MQPQGTDGWMAERLGIPTASRYKDVLSKGKGREDYKIELALERITGIPTESYVSQEMIWGTNTEELAVVAFESVTGLRTDETGFIRHSEIETGCSPDRLITLDSGLEIKCPKTSTHLATLRANKMPIGHKAQVQGCMWVTKRDHWYFESFDPRLPVNAQIFIQKIDRDEEYIAKLEAEIIKFNEEVDALEEFIRSYGQTI